MRKALSRGFTLIELLVVIAIIALLIALLLPTFLPRLAPAVVQCAQWRVGTANVVTHEDNAENPADLSDIATPRADYSNRAIV